MKINEVICAKGSVRPSFVGPNGEAVAWDRRHNTLSYLSSKAMAAAFGGDPRFIPTHIGIIYGNDDTYAPPGEEISRSQDWSALQSDLGEHNDVQVRPFSYSPSVRKIDAEDSSSESDSSSGSGMAGYAVTFHACSDSQTPGSFHPTEAGIFTADMNIYQAVLLNVRDGEDPLILARVSLKHGDSYRSKPENFEVALDWTVKFL